MSVRAYPIKINHEELVETFNLWLDEDVMDAIIANDNYYSNLNGDVGLIVIDKPELEKIKEHLKERKKLNKENKEIMKRIEENIKKGVYNYICY